MMFSDTIQLKTRGANVSQIQKKEMHILLNKKETCRFPLNKSNILTTEEMKQPFSSKANTMLTPYYLKTKRGGLEPWK